MCEDMAHDLAELSQQYPFTIEKFDIDRDPDLRARYDVLVPVLSRDGHEICHHFLDTVALRSALASE